MKTQTSQKWWHGWVPVAVFPAATVAFFPADFPRWAFMWALAITIYASCKWLTWRQSSVFNSATWIDAGYLLAWPGLDANTFLQPKDKSELHPCTWLEWGIAAFELSAGLTILFSVARCIPTDYSYLAGWIGMVGLVLTLHFGIFKVLSCIWRGLGVDARPIMNGPLASTSISDFWGRRWNTAFRDLTNRFLFRPLTPYLGAKKAMVIGFFLSGLIHDLVISVPAQGGYGGPTLFFCIQALALLTTHSSVGRRLGLRNGIRGRVFAASVLVFPISLLFHSPFVGKIILPFMKAIGAIL